MNKIARLDRITGVVTEFDGIPPDSITPGSEPVGITTGPDGNIWFTEIDKIHGNKIGRLDLNNGVVNNGVVTSARVKEFPIPTPDCVPYFITTGPDGNLWFVEQQGNKIGSINPNTGFITEFVVPTLNSFPRSITTGPDGNLWFPESTGNKIGRITPAGVFAEFGGLAPHSDPVLITAGPDGNLWFSEQQGNQIGRITITGTPVEEFPIPTLNSGVIGIATGPDGNIWCTEINAAKVVRIRVR